MAFTKLQLKLSLQGEFFYVIPLNLRLLTSTFQFSFNLLCVHNIFFLTLGIKYQK